jgi:hypothetical protein
MQTKPPQTRMESFPRRVLSPSHCRCRQTVFRSACPPCLFFAPNAGFSPLPHLQAAAVPAAPRARFFIPFCRRFPGPQALAPTHRRLLHCVLTASAAFPVLPCTLPHADPVPRWRPRESLPNPPHRCSFHSPQTNGHSDWLLASARLGAAPPAPAHPLPSAPRRHAPPLCGAAAGRLSESLAFALRPLHPSRTHCCCFGCPDRPPAQPLRGRRCRCSLCPVPRA